MTRDGKQLEGLVAYVEKALLPQGFDVKTNQRKFNDEGIQIAEFDIEIRGKVGSTNIAWLIECRDRPGSGAAPGSWIEQLVGRRTRFQFNKVTAVSTTGFAIGAAEFAKAQGIELREVKSLAADQFSEWMVIRHIHRIERQTFVNSTLFLIDSREPEDRRCALREVISSISPDTAFLKSTSSKEYFASKDVFANAVAQQETLFDDVEPNEAGKQVKLHVKYPDDADHFTIETRLDEVRIRAIVFEGELFVKEIFVPLENTAEYACTDTGETISQVASFAPQQINGMSFSFEMHKLAETGETHITMRCVKNA